jgi:3-oxo-4,17-pregnadiene-20-carboxyl-CoA hydratase alpha subunit
VATPNEFEIVAERELGEGRLVLQQCTKCGQIRYPARGICPECQSLTFEWTEAKGMGVVESFIWYFHSPTEIPDFPLPAPYNVAAIRLREGPVLTSNVVRVDFGELECGDVVQAEFDAPGTEGSAVLRFHKSEQVA